MEKILAKGLRELNPAPVQQLAHVGEFHAAKQTTNEHE
jgi:hypothetical protein